MTAPSTFKFSLACGPGGSWLEVTNDVLFEEGTIPFTDGRTSQFDGFRPGVWSFTLANGDGKYTPENPSSSLAVKLTEGMGVCMQLDGLLISGTVRSAVLVFPPHGRAAEARVRVTVDDMLGDLARHDIEESVAEDLYGQAGGLLRWELDVSATATAAPEASGGPALIPTGAVTFGVESQLPNPTSTAFTYSGGLSYLETTLPPVELDSSSVGHWSFWALRTSATAFMQFEPSWALGGSTHRPFSVRSPAGTITMQAEGGVNVVGPSFDPWQPYFIEVASRTTFSGTWSLDFELFVNGVSYGISTYTGSIPTSFPSSLRQPRSVRIGVNGPADGSFYAANLSYSRSPFNEYGLHQTTAEGRIPAIVRTVPGAVLDTLPTMASSVLSDAGTSGSALDVLSAVIRTEQGALWAETTGTLLNPVQKIKVGARNRQRGVDYTFDVSEILDPIPLVRSLTNTVSEATASGPQGSATYRDTSLLPLVGSASTSDSVLFRDQIDLYAYASDRVNRGINHGIAVQSITIDATSPLISRWADLTAIRQGHRLHITGLPTTQLGYSTWDGFVVGREIENWQDQNGEPKTYFTFHLSPWSHVSVYGTDVYGTATYGF